MSKKLFLKMMQFTQKSNKCHQNYCGGEDMLTFHMHMEIMQKTGHCLLAMWLPLRAYPNKYKYKYVIRI